MKYILKSVKAKVGDADIETTGNAGIHIMKDIDILLFSIFLMLSTMILIVISVSYYERKAIRIEQELATHKAFASHMDTTITGVASYYAHAFHGKRTANGEKFDMNAMTAAHLTLPFNTLVLVTLGDSSVIVRINDRGSYIPGRDIDLSLGAAKKLGMVEAGISEVGLTILK